MIRDWMGDFSAEKVVAKHAARMGQCFSSSVSVCVVDPGRIKEVPDIERNGHVFSDGVGSMSMELAKRVRHQMNLPMDPSALQVRIGGAKGVLAVNLRLPKDTEIQLRPSQIKFKSDHSELEVVKVATYRVGHLNRQVIVLMSARGVDDDYIMQLVHRMMRNTESILTDPLEALLALSPRSDDFGTSEMLVNDIKAGFHKNGDPFIRNILTLFRCSLLKELKKKAKILVPDSTCVIGVIDETGLLEENQVFVQVWDNSIRGNIRKVVTGRVAVFRNPSLHPGDIRDLEVVDIPELRHLRNVIVFSSKGDRDVPSMCSGGDLDGDEYMQVMIVIWDPRLIPPIPYNPMNYHAEEPKRVDQVNMNDIKDSFVKYVQHDSLGQIANAYLANTDIYGPMDLHCIELAQLHSRAVDFAKTGRRAVMQKHLIPEKYPDFMQKKDKVEYTSPRVLEESPAFDSQFYVNGMLSHVPKARLLREEYDRKLTALMNQHGMLTETELLSGYLIKWQKKGKSRTIYKQHENMLRSVRQFKTEWKDEFEEEFLDWHNMLDLSRRDEIYAKAAAWYYVTYHPDERNRYSLNYFSFPWTIYKYLCFIKQDKGDLLDSLTESVANLNI
ncbi:unnamed protein product [Rhizopus stolonifer]